jgi:hypothetical protein
MKFSQKLLKTAILTVAFATTVAVNPTVFAQETPDRSAVSIAVGGDSDWSIVPANLTPQFVFNGTDGNFYVRHLPLVGKITLAGRGVSIEGKISADFNGDLDATFSGPVWAPVTITAVVNGSNTVIFEGNASGTTVGLVSTGVIKLEGRGSFEGNKLEFEFVEKPPGNSDTYKLNGTVVVRPGR